MMKKLAFPRMGCCFILPLLSLCLLTLCLIPIPPANAASELPDASASHLSQEGGPLKTFHTDHFDFSYSPSLTPNVAEYAKWLEVARIHINDVLQFLPVLPVPVTICATPTEFRNLTGLPLSLGGIMAGGALIYLPDPENPGKGAEDLTRLYTRLCVFQITGGKAAPWLIRGIEGYLTDEFTPSLPLLAPAAQAGKLGSLGPGTGPTAAARRGSPLSPELREAEAVFAVYFLQQTVGERTLSRLLSNIGAGQGWTEAIKSASALDPEQFEEGWMNLAKSGVRSFTPPGEAWQSWSTPVRTIRGVPHAPTPGQQALIRIAVGDTTVGLTEQVDALLVAGGNVMIRGTVTSRIGVLGGSLRLAPTARVSGQITVLGGSLTVDPGAAVEGTAEVSANHWDPALIQSDRANLKVVIDRPIHVDLRLPGQAYTMQEGTITVPQKQTLDAAVAVAGSVDVAGAVTGRAVAIGGDVKLTSAPAEGWQGVAAGGRVLVKGKPMESGASPSVTQLPHFDTSFTAPVQPGPDPVPIYLGVGDSAVGVDQFYDAVLCVGGNCLVNGTVRGGLVAGGDLAALRGSLVTGPVWIFGGHVRAGAGSNTKGLDVHSDVVDEKQ